MDTNNENEPLLPHVTHALPDARALRSVLEEVARTATEAIADAVTQVTNVYEDYVKAIVEAIPGAVARRFPEASPIDGYAIATDVAQHVDAKLEAVRAARRIIAAPNASEPETEVGEVELEHLFEDTSE
jgi:phage terminase Nu1 subunit (DNA packaging protein)